MVMATPITQLKFDSQDTLTIQNVGDKTVTFKLPRQKFIIEPGQIAFVPFNLVRIYFGDPRSIAGTRRMFDDSTGKGTIPSRELEVTRLKTLYGVYGEDTLKLEDVAPKITIKTTTGREILPPLYDRDGSKSEAQVGPRSISDLANVETLGAIIAKHESDLEMMRQYMDKVKANGSNEDGDVKVDLADTETMPR